MTARARIRGVARLLALVCSLVPAVPAHAYLKLGANVKGAPTLVKWKAQPVRYYLSDRTVPQVGPADLQAAVARAFATWQAVPTSAIAYEFAGFTSGSPLDEDGMTTVGFVDQPSLDRVLGTTSFTVDESTGELIEADIVLNSAFAWSTAAAGEAGRYDLESIALHEIGHLSGLGHSALGETELRTDGTRRVIAAASVMFPIAFSAGTISARTLKDDDVAGISDIYPDGGFNEKTGSVSGRVTKNGAGVYGAHVVAFSPATGALIANFTLDDDGRFSIAGLSPGAWVIRVEPLDDAELESFFESPARVDLNFQKTFSDRLAIVPRGGDSGPIQLQVAAK